MINLTENEKYIITKMQAGSQAVITFAHLTFVNTTHYFASLWTAEKAEPTNSEDVLSLLSKNLVQLSKKEEGAVDSTATFVKDFYDLTDAGKAWPNAVSETPEPEVEPSNLMKFLPFIVGGIALFFILIYVFS